MGKKLTEQEKRQREVNKATLRIKGLEKSFSSEILETACIKYKNLEFKKRKATEDYKDAERRLAEAKKKLKI